MQIILRLIFAVAALLVPSLAAAAGITVAIACGAVGAELRICEEGARIWAQRTGNEVRLVSVPSSATERLALYQQFFASRSPDIDVYQIDVIWPGLLAEHLEDLRARFGSNTLAQHIPALIANNTVGNRLVAVPWFADIGVLYYRRDLLEKYRRPVPGTWSELSETARLIQEGERREGNARMQGFVFQGRAYEGLTCNALEWIDSYGGGTIVDQTGRVTVNNPRSIAALRQAWSWVGTIAPRGVLNYTEEEARGVFQSGDAVFMRNWPYAWALMESADSRVRGQVAVAPLPRGEAGKPSGTLGGSQLAVSRYSRNREAAIDLVRYLTSGEEQERRAVGGAFLPTIAELHHGPRVVAALPFIAFVRESLGSAVARPSTATGGRYNQVSFEFFTAVHAVMAGEREAGRAMEDLEQRLERLRRGGRW